MMVEGGYWECTVFATFYCCGTLKKNHSVGHEKYFCEYPSTDKSVAIFGSVKDKNKYSVQLD